MPDDFFKILNGGTFSLDTGAVFGITPKVSWERFFNPNSSEFWGITLSQSPLLFPLPSL